MPLYDYMYGTVDDSTDALHESSIKRGEDSPDVVHLTHLTTPDSIYHLRLGFASVASKPQMSNKWYLWFMWPLTCWSMIFTCIYGTTFVAERNTFKNLKLQSWVMPRFITQVYIFLPIFIYITFCHVHLMHVTQLRHMFMFMPKFLVVRFVNIVTLHVTRTSVIN